MKITPKSKKVLASVLAGGMAAASVATNLVSKVSPKVGAVGMKDVKVTWESDDYVPGELTAKVEGLGRGGLALLAYPIKDGARQSLQFVHGGSAATGICSDGTPATGGIVGDGELHISYDPKLAGTEGIEWVAVASDDPVYTANAADTAAVNSNLAVTRGGRQF